MQKRGKDIPRRTSAAFTIVELMVVIAIIALILAIGLPAFNSMTIQQRLSKTRQLLNGTITRTHIISVSDKNMAAVRLYPAKWHMDEGTGAGVASSKRQAIATYSWKQTSMADPANPLLVSIEERFERIEDGPMHILPPDTWIAPAEAFALNTTRDMVYHHEFVGGSRVLGDYVLDGVLGKFELDAAARGENFLDADDFLIVFDPEAGVVRSANGMRRNAWLMQAFDPRPAGTETGQTETSGVRRGDGTLNPFKKFERHNFTGAVVYRREPFETLEQSDLSGDELIAARRDVLKRFGNTYYVSRGGGGLISGAEQ